MSSSKSKSRRHHSDSEDEDRRTSKSSVFERLGGSSKDHKTSSGSKHESSERREREDYERRDRERDYRDDRGGSGERGGDRGRYENRGGSRFENRGRFDRPQPKRESDKRDPCKFLFKNGYCNYGPNCIFYHDRERYEKEYPNAETRPHRELDSAPCRSDRRDSNRPRDENRRDDRDRSRRDYSSSPERREVSADRAIKSTITVAPKEDRYSSDELTDVDASDLQTLDEKLQRYKELASKQSIGNPSASKRSGPRTPSPEPEPEPSESKPKLMKKKGKKKPAPSSGEEPVKKRKKVVETKKKAKRSSSVESNQAEEGVDKKKKKLKSGEKVKAGSKVMKKKSKSKAEVEGKGKSEVTRVERSPEERKSRSDETQSKRMYADRGREREEKFAAGGRPSPRPSGHNPHHKDDRGRPPSPGDRRGDRRTPPRSRSPGDKRLPVSPGYGRGPGDYRGGRDYPPPPGMPGPGPDGYYDRERPPYPHFDGPDRGGFRGRGRGGYGDRPPPDRMPYGRYGGGPPPPGDHYGGPPPPHDDRYGGPDDRGGYRGGYRGRGTWRGRGRGRGGYGGHDGPGYPDGPPHYDDRHPADDRGPRYKRDRSPPPRDRESDRVERVGSPDRKRQRNESDRRSRSRDRERDRERRGGSDFGRSPRTRRETETPEKGRNRDKRDSLSAKDDSADQQQNKPDTVVTDADSQEKPTADKAATSAETEDLEQNKEEVAVTDVVGILDVDWQSLMSTNTATKPKPSSSTDALERFSPANILSRIGISKKYAGQERVDKVQNLLNQHNAGSLRDDLGELHIRKVREETQRSDLFKSIGSYRKALIASRDIRMRRLANYMNPTENLVTLPSYNTQNVDRDLLKQGLRLLTGKIPELVTAPS